MSSPSDLDEATGFTIGERLGIFLNVQAAILSGTAILVLVGYKLLLYIRRSRQDRSKRSRDESDACDSSLFLSLMAGEMLRAIGASMSLRWVLDGEIQDGSFCVAQGYIKLIGTNTIDFSTLAITIQTFSVLILRWNAPKHIAKVFSAVVWIVVLLIATISYGVHPKDLMGPTNFWCWIPRRNRLAQIMAEYLWMWIIAGLTALLYGLGYLVVRGYVEVHNRFSLRWKGRKGTQATLQNALRTGSKEDQEVRKMANQLLAYPLIYLLCIIPFSFSRWFYFVGKDVPEELTLFTRTLFSLSGLFNVILFFNTRYDLVAGGASNNDDDDDGEGDVPKSVNDRESAHSAHELAYRPSVVSVTKHGRLPKIPESHIHTIYPAKRDGATGATTPVLAGDHEYNPYTELDRGRRFFPERSGSASVSYTRNPSSSAQRTDDGDSDEDYGRLPS